MMRHMDEARKAAIKFLQELIGQEKNIYRIVLLDDLFGKMRVVIWSEGESEEMIERIDKGLESEASPYWSKEIFIAQTGDEADRFFYERAWDEGIEDEEIARLRITDRYRSRRSWLQTMGDPPWEADIDEGGGSPVLVFYSFKGGVGRSTALAAFAIQRARMGERIAVVDFDLDAPGVGVLLAADEMGTTAAWGVLDYLLERPYGQGDLGDYYHVCRRERVIGPGEVMVFPAGRMDERYLAKLARIDFEPPAEEEEEHPLLLMLKQIRAELNPDWVLIDARAGLSDPAGLLLGGLAHMYTIFGTSSEQSWQGIRLVIQHLGAQRVLEGKRQIEGLLVQAMVPEDAKVAKMAEAEFSDRARDEFAAHYYAEDPENPEEDTFWYMRDIDDPEVPHVPVALSYSPKLAHFDLIDDVADYLAESPEFRALAERIAGRFGKSEG